MRIGRVDPSMATLGYGSNHKIRQGELVPVRGESTSKIGRSAPIAPTRFDIVCQLQSRCHPIGLVLAPETQKHFGENRSQQSNSV